MRKVFGFGIRALVLGAAVISLAWAQPAPPKNLQVLPKDIPRPELMKLMQEATQGLGVQCDFCHVPREMDKDDKPAKQAAREMYKMVLDLRGHKTDYLTNGREAKINCWTCHRGAAHIELPPPPPPMGQRRPGGPGAPAAEPPKN